MPLNSRDNNSELSLLHQSVKYSNAGVVQHLINLGYKINSQDNQGITPLMLAVKKQELTMIDMLLKNRADVYVKDNTGTSSLQLAIEYQFYSGTFTSLRQKSYFILELLFTRVNEEFFRDNRRVGELLLNDNNRLVALAAVVFGNVELTRYLLKNGYQNDYRDDKWNFTAIYWAVIFARIDNIKLLIEYGADICGSNGIGKSIITCYTWNCQIVDENSEVLKILLKRSDNLTLPDKYRVSEIERLFLFGNKKSVKVALQFDLINFTTMIFYGGKCLIHLLMKNDDAEVHEVLDELNVKFHVDSRDSYGITALMIAARCGFLKKVEFLLERGADANATLFSGESVLHYAVTYSSMKIRDKRDLTKITELLLQYGADAQVIASHGSSVMDVYLFGDRQDSLKAIVANLAIDRMKISYSTRAEIESDSTLKAHFGKCRRQLELISNVEVYGDVTLFELLIECDKKKIMNYANDRRFKLTFNCVMKRMLDLEPYYFNTLRRKVSEVIEKVELDNKATVAIEFLTGLNADAYHTIVCKIICYLNTRDLQRLCRVVNIRL